MVPNLGLLDHAEGDPVLLGGQARDAREPLAERRRMATVFQDPLLADASVADNAGLGLRFRGVPAAEAAPRVARWLERLGVAALAGRGPRPPAGGGGRRRGPGPPPRVAARRGA